MDSSSQTEIREGQICSIYTANDLEASRFTVDGKQADPQLAKVFRQKLKEALGDLLGKEGCQS